MSTKTINSYTRSWKNERDYFRKHGMPVISGKHKSQHTFNTGSFISKNYIYSYTKNRRIHFYIDGKMYIGIL